MIRFIWARMSRDTRAMIALTIIALLVCAAVAAPLLARHDPLAIELANQLQGPSLAHWMGTDFQGRDVWARVLYGARVSLAVGFVSQIIALTLGVVLGLVSATTAAGWMSW